MSPVRPRWVSVTRYCQIYQVNRKTVTKWRDEGLLESFQVHKIIRVANHLPRTAQSHKGDVYNNRTDSN